eukprot:Gb_03289 [translate_table: standard]
MAPFRAYFVECGRGMTIAELDYICLWWPVVCFVRV